MKVIQKLPFTKREAAQISKALCVDDETNTVAGWVVSSLTNQPLKTNKTSKGEVIDGTSR